MHQALLSAASKVPAGSYKAEHPLPPLQPVLEGWPGCRAWLPLGSPYVCVFCSPGRLPVFPDQVHTLEIQQFLRVPTLGLRARLADGTLFHGLYSSLCHLHPSENQRTPETATEAADFPGGGPAAAEEAARGGAVRTEARGMVSSSPGGDHHRERNPLLRHLGCFLHNPD